MELLLVNGGARINIFIGERGRGKTLNFIRSGHDCQTVIRFDNLIKVFCFFRGPNILGGIAPGIMH